MRLISLAFLGSMILACAGGEAPPATPPSPEAPPATPAAKAAPAVATRGALAAIGSPADAALAEHYLVILGSKADPAEIIPGVEALKADAQLGSGVRQVLSSRFKNLMPCYAVTIAGANADKKAALALSKQLTARGVDNYVKNAGAWVGPSPAIDAYCAAGDAPLTEEVRVPHLVDGALWLPVVTSADELAALVARAPAPVARSDRYDAWIQPLGAAEPARYKLVEATTGVTRGCTATEDALLTLGTPHFGALQGDGPPEAPACGSAARFHRLECDGAVPEGHWVAVPDAATIAPYTPLGEASSPLVDAARALFTARTDWDAPSGNPDAGEVERTLTVTRWKGPAGEVAVVEAHRADEMGVCGGDDFVWFGVFGVAGDTLGAGLGAIQEASFAHVKGLVDIAADGRPDLVVTSFPQTTTVYDSDGGAAASLAVDFCDCAC